MTELYQGRVLEVDERRAGSEVAQAYLANATILNIYNTGDFDDVGGEVEIEGQVYPYITKDDDLSTITLGVGLAVGIEVDTEVYLYPDSYVKEATVAFDVEDPPAVTVPQHLYDAMDVGVREESEQESVTVRKTGDRGVRDWVIEDIIGQRVLRDGTFIDPTTLPDMSTGPTEPPVASPEVRVTGTVDTLVVEAVGEVASTTQLIYQMSMDYNPDTQVGTWTDLPDMPTRATVMPVTTEPSGVILENGVIYWLRAQATNGILPNPAPGVPASAVLDPTKVTERVEAILKAGTATFGTIHVGPGEWDPDVGLSIPQSDGQVTLISSVPAVESNWAGKVSASFITMLQGILTGLLTVLGKIRLAFGVSNPGTAPEVGLSWTVERDLATGGGGRWGLCDTQDGTGWVVLRRDLKQLEVYSKASGALLNTIPIPNWTAWVGNVTRVGGHYFVLVLASGTAGLREYQVIKMDMAGTRVAIYWTDIYDTDVAQGHPAMGATGTDYVLTYPLNNSNNNIYPYVGFRATDGVRTIYTGTGGANMGALREAGGFARGNFDYGALRQVIAPIDADPRVFSPGSDTTATITREIANEFFRAASAKVRGLWWDGTRFYSMNDAGRIYRYGTNEAEMTLDISYAWLSENGTLETMLGPDVTYVQPARANLAVSTPPPPQAGETGSTKANRVSVYAALTGVAPVRQNDGFIGQTLFYLRDDLESGKSPEGANQFAGISSQGRFEAEQGGFWIDGSSNGSVGDAGTGFRLSVEDVGGPFMMGSPSHSGAATSTFVTLATFGTSIELDRITRSSGVFTFTRAGRYSIVFNAGFAPNGTGDRIARVAKNGNLWGQDRRAALSGTGVRTIPSFVQDGRFAVGDTLEFQAWQNSGVSLAVESDYSSVSIKYLGA